MSAGMAIALLSHVGLFVRGDWRTLTLRSLLTYELAAFLIYCLFWLVIGTVNWLGGYTLFAPAVQPSALMSCGVTQGVIIGLYWLLLKQRSRNGRTLSR